MDRNERLLSRVLQERSGHGRLPRISSNWLLAGVVVLGVVATAVAFRLQTSPGPADEARSKDGSADRVTSTAPQPTAEIVRAATLPAPTIETGIADSGPHRYVVQPGDSVQSIAERNHLRPATLASVNQLENPDILQPGRELIVPVADGIVHIVQPGETLRMIAERYDVDVATLVRANQLTDPDHIAVGLRLFVPDTKITDRH